MRSVPWLPVNVMDNLVSTTTVHMQGQDFGFQGKVDDQEYLIRLCDSSLELGYEDITCSNTSEIIYVDLLTYETSCGPVRTIYKEDCITIIDYKQFRMMVDVQEHLKLVVIQTHLLSHLRINVAQQL